MFWKAFYFLETFFINDSIQARVHFLQFQHFNSTKCYSETVAWEQGEEPQQFRHIRNYSLWWGVVWSLFDRRTWLLSRPIRLTLRNILSWWFPSLYIILQYYDINVCKDTIELFFEKLAYWCLWFIGISFFLTLPRFLLLDIATSSS
jgi:hypothetical protein